MTRRRRPASPRPGPPRPYLLGETRALFDAWLAAAVERFVPPLRFSEVRKGVQALSALYVEKRAGSDLAARAREGAGKRAALATYYAPLHFLVVHHALAAAEIPALGPVRRVLDLGCGTGAAGAAVVRALPAPARVSGIDRSGSALAEARHTWAAFGISGRARRAALPRAMPRAREGDLVLLAWAANELGPAARATLLAGCSAGLRAGAALLVFEPLARPASPWWPEWVGGLAPLGVAEHEVRFRLVLPEWIARLDRAAHLDHRELGARLLVGRAGGAAPAARRTAR